MIKLLLIGLGRWGINHLRNLHALPIELFVAEAENARLEPARKLSMGEDRLTSDYHTFADRIDAVVVVTPAQSHYQLCREFLEAGKDVFVEKPICLGSDEARQLAELAAARKRILQVGHIFRFDPASLWFHHAIAAGQFGRVCLLRGNFSGFKRPRNDSGVAFADAIHFVDLFNFILDSTPRRVCAVTQDFLGRGMDDAALLSLEYPRRDGTAWATVEANYFLPGKFREVTVIGTELAAVCDFNAAQYKIRTLANKHVQEGADFKALEGTLRQVESPPEEPLLAELRGFIDCVQTRQQPRADAWSGYHSVRVLEAALASARTGMAVDLA